MRSGSMTVAAAALVSLALAGAVDAAEIRLLSAGAVRSIVEELAEGFRQETGHTVKASFGPVGATRQKLESGEPADLLILTDSAIDDLATRGVVVAGSRTDIARTAIGVAVREGAPKPDISTPQALRQTLLAARSIVYVDPARGATSGIHFASVLGRLGIADAVKDKTILKEGGFAAEAVAKGEAELCVHQISEIVPVKGVTLVGPLPAELQKITTYSAGLLVRSDAQEAARAFLAYVTRPAFKAKFAAAGFGY